MPCRRHGHGRCSDRSRRSASASSRSASTAPASTAHPASHSPGLTPTFSLGAHVGLNGNIAVLDFEDQPSVVHAEGSTGNNFLLKPREVRRCKLLLKRLQDLALDPADTKKHLAKTLKELT